MGIEEYKQQNVTTKYQEHIVNNRLPLELLTYTKTQRDVSMRSTRETHTKTKYYNQNDKTK